MGLHNIQFYSQTLPPSGQSVTALVQTDLDLSPLIFVVVVVVVVVVDPFLSFLSLAV